MDKAQYADYIGSEHWQNFRKEILSYRDKCERCSLPRWLAQIAYGQNLHLHHRNYSRLGEETDAGVEVLCRRCHEIETFGRSELAAPKTAVCEVCQEIHWNPWADCCEACAKILDWHVTKIRKAKDPGREGTVGEFVWNSLFCPDDPDEVM